MSGTDPLRPVDLFKLCEGPVRVAICDLEADNPPAAATNLADILALVPDEDDEFPLATGYRDVGAAKEGEGSSYSHGRETSSLGVEQIKGAVFEDIDEISRGMAFNIAEVDHENVKFIENAATVETIAAAGGKSAQKAVVMESYSQLRQYRVAMIGYRRMLAGDAASIVTMGAGGPKRGRIAAVYFDVATLSSDDTEIEMEKGSLWSGEVGLTSFLNPSTGKYGRWFFEQGGTIAVS